MSGFSAVSQRSAALAFSINSGHRLIDLVRDRCRQLARRCQTVHVRQFGHGVARTDLGKRPPPVLVNEPGNQPGQ